jgi:hypothetical protein
MKSANFKRISTASIIIIIVCIIATVAVPAQAVPLPWSWEDFQHALDFEWGGYNTFFEAPCTSKSACH